MGPRYSCDAVAAGGPAGRRAGATTLAPVHATVYRQAGGAAERAATPHPLPVQSRQCGHFLARPTALNRAQRQATSLDGATRPHRSPSRRAREPEALRSTEAPQRGASAAPAAKRSRGRALRPRRRPARKTEQRWGGAQAPPHRSLVRLTWPRRAAAPYLASAAGGTSPPLA